MSHSGYSFLAVLSFSGCQILSGQSYAACPVLPVLFCLSCYSSPVLPVLFCVSCSAYPVLPIPLCLSHFVYPPLPVLFCLSSALGYETGFPLLGEEKARIRAFFFRARRFRFFSRFFSSRFCALFWLRARERKSAKKVPAPTSDNDCL